MEELVLSHHQGCRWRHWKLIKISILNSIIVEFIQTLTGIPLKTWQILTITKFKKPGHFSDAKIYTYLKLAGENTPIQSSFDGFGEAYSNVTHSEFCP
jgi:hypothetical protein